MCLCSSLCLCLSLCVDAFVCERETKTVCVCETERKKETGTFCVWLWVFVCEIKCERQTEKEEKGIMKKEKRRRGLLHRNKSCTALQSFRLRGFVTEYHESKFMLVSTCSNTVSNCSILEWYLNEHAAMVHRDH